MWRKLLDFFQKDDAHEFKPTMAEIEEKPVHPLGKIVFWVVVATMLFFSLWSYFGKIDVVVSARGEVIPEGDVKILQPLDTGVVSAILCKEGDFVRKGQVLMEIDPSITAPELESKKKSLQFLEIEEQRLDSTLKSKGFSPDSRKYDHTSVETQRELFRSTLAGLQRQIEGKKAELCRLDEEMEGAENERSHNGALLKIALEQEQRLAPVLDIIARGQYEKALSDIAIYKNAVEQAASKLKQLVQQKHQTSQELAYLEENFRTTELKEYADKQKETTEIRADIDKSSFRNEKQRILSPVDGHISSLMFHTIGGVVTPAQKLMTVVPLSAPLVIKATVLNKDIGFVKEKMPVLIKVDTFDFQKYGTLNGMTRNIAKHSIEDEKLGPVYEVFVTPLQTRLRVEGVETSITSGMTVTSEIKVGKRRVIEFFIYPLVKYLDEGIKVR